MKLIRKIMQDRSSAGAVAMLAVLLFLLQGLANGVANSGMAAMALAAQDVICSTHAPDGVAGKEDPSGKIGNNCCGNLCRLAATSVAALPDAPTDVIGSDIPQSDITFSTGQQFLVSTPPNRNAQPRAPPHSPHA